MRLFRTPFLLQQLFPQLTWRVPHAPRTLYVTFDDGPIPEVTDFVLETLAAHQAKATFFWVGDNVKRHPAEAKRVLAAGHRVGNHTFNHLDGWRNPLPAYLENTARCQDAIREASQGQLQEPLLFRPPYGKISRPGIKALRPLYQIVMWDVLPYDFDATLAPEECLQQTIKSTRPGSILVFHDSLKAERNLRYVLPRFLRHFREQGYTFASL